MHIVSIPVGIPYADQGGVLNRQVGGADGGFTIDLLNRHEAERFGHPGHGSLCRGREGLGQVLIALPVVLVHEDGVVEVDGAVTVHIAGIKRVGAGGIVGVLLETGDGIGRAEIVSAGGNKIQQTGDGIRARGNISCRGIISGQDGGRGLAGRLRRPRQMSCSDNC